MLRSRGRRNKRNVINNMLPAAVPGLADGAGFLAHANVKATVLREAAPIIMAADFTTTLW